MYGNEALSYNQWHDTEFTNSNENCQYVDYNLTSVLPPPGSPGFPEDVYNIITSIFEAFQSSIVCNGDDVLEQFEFTTVNLISFPP